MRFIKLHLNNWRNFQGRYSIDFHNPLGKNITLIIGQNGSGKTALLNSFTWVLFGETTAGFRKPEDLFNQAALKAIPINGSDTMEVVLEFSHDGNQIHLKRLQEAHRGQDNILNVSDTIFYGTRTIGGLTDSIDQEYVNSILPPGLHPFFFFPAENIGRDIDQNDTAGIRASMSRAIDVLLGIQRYEHSLKVVSTALSKHLKTPKGVPRDKTIVDAEGDAKDKRKKWEDAVSRLKELPEQISLIEGLVAELEQQMNRSEENQSMIDEMKRIKSEIHLAEHSISELHDEQMNEINQYCAIIFGTELFRGAGEVLNKAYEINQIPPRVSSGLLADLIKKGTCICGRELGSDEISQLESLRSQTIEDNVAESATNLRGLVPPLFIFPSGQEIAENILKKAKTAIETESELVKLGNRRLELLDENPAVSYADQQKVQDVWKIKSKTALRLRNELEMLGINLPTVQREKDDAEKRYQTALNKQAAAYTIGRARELMSIVEKTLSIIQDIIRTSARKDVERAMNQFYGPLLLKNYIIRLTDDFHHEIIDPSTNRTVGVASSEIALAIFAFVSALAGLMPVYSGIENILPSGDEPAIGAIQADIENAYPVVLDAPHSPFGVEYAEDFSNALPELLPQSVIIIREDQLKFMKSLIERKAIGSAYILQLHSTKVQNKTISWGGHDFAYLVRMSESETSYTKIISLPTE